jgi:hypothetical protein
MEERNHFDEVYLKIDNIDLFSTLIIIIISIVFKIKIFHKSNIDNREY